MSSAVADPNAHFGDRPLADDVEWGTPTGRNAGDGPHRNNGLTKYVFRGLSSLLIITLVFLLVELNYPGQAARAASRLMSYKPTEVPARQAYSPVPAPFLAPKASRFAEVDAIFSPTSEPTVKYMAGQYIDTVPTSEPTELSGTAAIKYANDSPTFEPTTLGQLFKPTNEPTVFVNRQGGLGRPTSEPTVFTAVPGQSYPGQTPTTQGGGIQTQNGSPTSEPTIFTQINPNNGLPSPTSEPTIFFAPVVPTGGVNKPTSEPTVFILANSPPTPLETWHPTSFISFAPTSDPTHYPTPEPTLAI